MIYQVKDIKQKSWFPMAWNIFLIVTVIVLLFIVFRGCGKGNTHKDEKSKVDSIIQRENANEIAFKEKVRFYASAYDSIHRENEIRKSHDEVLRRQISVTENKVIDLVNRGRAIKIIHDTPAYVQNCDTLAVQASVLTMRIDELTYSNQQLQANYEAQINNRDSLAAAAIEARSGLKMSFDNVSASYNNLYKDYSKVVKKGKRARTLNRILGATTLGLGTILYFKK